MAQSTCKIEDCSKPSRAKGWCEMHYCRWRAHGDPLVVKQRGRPRKSTPCSVDGCEKPSKSQNLCPTHYSRWRLGRPLDVPLRIWKAVGNCEVEGCERPYCARGLCSMHWQRMRDTGEVGPVGLKVAPAGSGYVRPSGYKMIQRNGRSVLEHRALMEDLLGRPLERHETVHHVHGPRDNNVTDGPLKDYRSGNLELWSTWQPAGQRVSDKVEFAVELLTKYRPDLIRQTLEKESVRG